MRQWISFQFPLLGIFRCTTVEIVDSATLVISFQFPLLGIFRCTVRVGRISRWRRLAFNSRYLGFSVAPWAVVDDEQRFFFFWSSSTKPIRLTFFQFPLLGIFRCTLRVLVDTDDELGSFQFPLLGIFPCTLSCWDPLRIMACSGSSTAVLWVIFGGMNWIVCLWT